MESGKENEAKAFAEYLQSTVRLDALETMTTALDDQLADARQMMSNIKAMFDSIPNCSVAESSGYKPEELSQILVAGQPQILLPDMNDSVLDVDLDAVISTMKGYAEDLKKSCTLQQSQPPVTSKPKEVVSLDLQQYASSLDLLGRRLANIKLSKAEDISNRNVELEEKLTCLCQDVNMFTQMVESKTTLSEHNKNWSQMQQDNKALYYDEIIDKLLADITEVTYLLQNKN